MGYAIVVCHALKLLIGVGLKNKTEYVDDCNTFYEQGTMLTYIGRTQNWPLSAGGLIIYLGAPSHGVQIAFDGKNVRTRLRYSNSWDSNGWIQL